MSERAPVGIDLGTTHSLVAVLRDDGPHVLADEQGRSLVPSVIAVDDGGRVLVGEAARQRLASRPGSAVARFKPAMGTDTRFELGGRSHTPVTLSALVLRELARIAERGLGAPLREAVISVPAWFGETQRRATLEAATLAGLEVRRLVNEPTAAALAHTLHTGPEPRTVAVVDLGGGTFDVTLLELFDGVVDVRATVGDTALGGEDFTDLLLDRHWTGHPARRGEARAAAERAKRALAGSPSAELAFPGREPITVTREELDLLAGPLLARIRRSLREALVRAGIRPAALDEVVLAGGATRMPAVGRIVEELYGRAPVAAADVDRVVALGAAVQAGLVARHGAVHERLVNDVLTHSLGVRVAHTVDGRLFHDRFSPVLSRGTVLPATRSEVFSTVEPRQTRVVLEVYEGEHRTVVENTFLGRLEVGELPPAPGPQPIDVRFAHDASGLLEIEATVHATGRRSRLVLERSGVRFTPEARAAAERDLAALAVHPKEEAGNRLSVERAIRLVELLAGPRRAALDDLVLAVEVALDRRDPAAIAFARDRLDGAVASIVAELGLDLS